MERGLLWLPLLAVFIWLAWAGWNEYQKVETYRTWAEQFQRAKYDIYAVMGQNGSEITWGQPTRQGPINLQTFSLREVKSIRLLADGRPISDADLPSQARTVTLEFLLLSSGASICIPFTELQLAAQWATHLQQDLNSELES